MVAAGIRRGLKLDRSHSTCRVAAWFEACVSNALSQWFAAVRTRTRPVCSAPVEDPPPPQK